MAEEPEVTEEEVYGNVYEVGEIHLSGTFTNCTININTGKPPDPPPGGGGN